MAELKDVVILNIHEYNRLKKLNDDLLKANAENRITFSYDYRNGQYVFYTNDEVLQKASASNKSLKEKYDEVVKEYESMRGYYVDNKREIEENIQKRVERQLKQMSIWKFIRWKKSK